MPSVIEDALAYTLDRLRAANVPAETADHIVLAVMEAVGNVVRHAITRAHAFELAVDVRRADVIIEVIDFGPGFTLSEREMPDAMAECGRGLPLMRRLCDSVAYHRGADRNRLVLKKRLG